MSHTWLARRLGDVNSNDYQGQQDERKVGLIGMSREVCDYRKPSIVIVLYLPAEGLKGGLK